MNSDKTNRLEERVRVLEAEWEIRNLVSTYLLKADVRDAEGYAETFAEDGVLDIGGLHMDSVGFEVESIHKGREAIAKVFRESIAPIPCFMWHLGHTPYIEVHGDKAIGRWGWTALARFPDSDPIEAGGVYDDEYVITDEGWRIKKRAITAWYTIEFGKWNSDQFFGPTR